MNVSVKWTTVFIWLIWFIFQAYWLAKFGIYQNEEAAVYINIAQQIVSGDWSHSIHYWLYSGYIVPLVIIKWMGLPLECMYLLQLALSFIALNLFIDMLKNYCNSSVAVFLGSLLFASCPVFQSWNAYLYTDGFFGSITVIALYAVAGGKPNGKKLSLMAAGILVLACFVRPVGFLLIPIALSNAIVNSFNRGFIAFLSIWFLIFGVFVLFALRNGTDFFYPGHNLELNIICGLSSELKQFEIYPYNDGMGIASYLISNPEMSVRLFAHRLFRSLWMTRPYFSTTHNIILAISCSVYYLLALLGTVYVFRKKILKYLYIYFGMFILLVPNILFCADWHNRFMVPFLPFLLIISTLGIDFLFHYRKKKTVLSNRITI